MSLYAFEEGNGVQAGLTSTYPHWKGAYVLGCPLTEERAALWAPCEERAEDLQRNAHVFNVLDALRRGEDDVADPARVSILFLERRECAA